MSNMGLPMVQKDTRRRSSLILGVLLALLLGVAAGFFVLAVPIRMLETVTTLTRLSKLMVQAEPPISPNDRTLLALLAGILTAGIGWVLVDWLLFGRAGMSRLIKPREDEYEDEDGDNFRPTDPLDLVSTVSLPVPEWAPPTTGDARRPLSARTDIGDPPMPVAPFGVPSMPSSGFGQPLNPFGQIPPGVGTPAPSLHPNVPPPLHQPGAALPPVGQQSNGGVWGASDPAAPGAPLPTSWPPLDLSTPESAIPATGRAEHAMPPASVWLPAPGVRPDGGQPRLDAEDLADAAPPPAEPVMAAPVAVPPSIFMPPMATSEPPVTPEPLIPPALTIRTAAPNHASVPPLPTPSLPESGFDKVRLEELLVRLERGLQNRRAAAAQRSGAVASPPPRPVAPAPVVARVDPPAAYAAPMPVAPPPMPIDPSPAVEPASVFGVAPTQPQGYAPPPVPPAPSPLMPPRSLGHPDDAAERNDAMLEQPLHVTLDLLRNMVKR